MKLLTMPKNNNLVSNAEGSQGTWKIDGLPLAVCRPATFDKRFSGKSTFTRDRYWIIVPSSASDIYADVREINAWLEQKRLGLDYHYPTRTQALDSLQMALASDPGFFNN